MSYIDRIPWWMVAAACVALGLAPFVPEPHIVEKLRMLWGGTLSRPIDIFDLLYHALPWLIGIVKFARLSRSVRP